MIRKRFRQRVPIKYRSRRYRGFDIQVVNNRTYSFKIEWVVTPVSTMAKRMAYLHAKRYRRTLGVPKFGDSFYDPTSMRGSPGMVSVFWVEGYAKDYANGLRSPTCAYSHW